MIKVIHDNKNEIVYDIGEYTAKQRKNNYGYVMEKVYLYTKDNGSYYYTTAFATFSSLWHLKMFMASKGA